MYLGVCVKQKQAHIPHPRHPKIIFCSSFIQNRPPTLDRVHELAPSSQHLDINSRLAKEQASQLSSYNNKLDSSQMHPPMSQQQYVHNDFGLYSSTHMNHHHPIVANPTQPLAFN